MEAAGTQGVLLVSMGTVVELGEPVFPVCYKL